MARSPHKKKKTAKEFKEYSGGVGGPGGVIVTGKRLMPTLGRGSKSTSTVQLRPNMRVRAKGLPAAVLKEVKGTSKNAILPSRLKPITIPPNMNTRAIGEVKKQMTKKQFEEFKRQYGIKMKGKK